MTQKTISLPENVYNSLKKQKKERETYADLISRLLNEKQQQQPSSDISQFYGQLEEEDKGEWDQIEDSIYKNRRISSKKTIEHLDD